MQIKILKLPSQNGKPIKIDPLTSASFKAKFVWSIRFDAAGFSTVASVTVYILIQFWSCPFSLDGGKNWAFKNVIAAIRSYIFQMAVNRTLRYMQTKSIGVSPIEKAIGWISSLFGTGTTVRVPDQFF